MSSEMLIFIISFMREALWMTFIQQLWLCQMVLMIGPFHCVEDIVLDYDIGLTVARVGELLN